MKHIVIAQRGWVYVGDIHTEGDQLVVENCQCIRKWGTPGTGLGGLANGPLSATELEPQGRTKIHQLAVVATIECPGWK